MRKFIAGGLLIVLCSLPFFTIHSSSSPLSIIPAYAQTNTPNLPIAQAGEHPRILITNQYLEQTVIPKFEVFSGTWSSFTAYVESDQILDDLADTPESVIRSLSLAWLITDETIYRDKILRAMQRLANNIEDSALLNTADATWDTQFLQETSALAIAYDWMYNVLSSNDRAALSDTLIRAATHIQDPQKDTERVWVLVDNDYQFQSFNSDSAQWLWTLTVVGLSLQGDRVEATNLLNTARNLWTQFALPTLDIQPNGAWAAGPVDGFTAIWWKLQTAVAWWTARGENYFDDTEWWYERMAYHLFLRYPSVQRTSNQDRGEAFLGYPGIIGAGERYHRNAVYGRTQDMLLRSIFVGTEYANWIDWSLNQPPNSSPDWLLVEEILWRDPNASGQPPDILTWRSIGTNHVFMRSNWVDTEGNLDSTATHVTYHSGDYFAPTQFFDQGSFTIWRDETDLVVHSGVYSGEGDSSHDANYYSRTVAGNTLLICNLAENFDGIWENNDTPSNVWLNDCGQRVVNPSNKGGINPNYWLANRVLFETANIERAYDENGATYIYSGITAAYNSTEITTLNNAPKVQSFIREFVYIRPSAVLIHDRLNTLSPDFTTINTLHFNARPQLDSNRWVIFDDSSALYVQHLAPNAQSTIIEGYVTAGQSVDTAFGQPTANQFESEQYGWYRMDTLPSPATTTPWFLTAFIATDPLAPVPLANVFVEGLSMRGAVISTPDVRWQVMFDDDPNNITQASFTVVEGVQFLLLTGLAPDSTYTMTWGDLRVQTEVTHSSGALLLPNPVAGPFSIQLGTP